MGGMRKTAPDGRRLAPGDRRRQILAAAKIMLETRSIEDVSVEAVAAEIGVSPGLVFHYFGTQKEFRRAVIQTVARELLAQMEPDPSLSPEVQLHAALDMFTAVVERSPRLYLAVVRADSIHQDGELGGLHRDIRALLADWLMRGLAEAGVPMTPAVTICVSGWLAFTEDALVTWITHADSMAREELIALCERACYRLLEEAIADPSRWPLKLTAAGGRRAAQNPSAAAPSASRAAA
jgi:AcrR family transcriptional regulator